MPLAPYIEETMRALGSDDYEVLVERAVPFRNNAGPREHQLVNEFNDSMWPAQV